MQRHVIHKDAEVGGIGCVTGAWANSKWEGMMPMAALAPRATATGKGTRLLHTRTRAPWQSL